MVHDFRHAFRMLLKSPGVDRHLGVDPRCRHWRRRRHLQRRQCGAPSAAAARQPGSDRPDMEQTGRGPRVAVLFPNFLDWREQTTAFAAMAASQGGRTVVVGGAEPVFADALYVTHGFFDVFGIRPMAGRTFTPEEERIGGVPAAVVSYAFWTQALGSNPDLPSMRIQVQGFACRVIGVMPAGFAYPASADLWMSKQLFEDPTTRTSHSNQVVARLRDGVTAGQATAELNSIAAQGPCPIRTGKRCHWRDRDVAARGALGWFATGAADAARHRHPCAADGLRQRGEHAARARGGEARRKELAIRAALGAARGRLMRQLLTENLVLSIAGALGGLLLAAWLVRVLVAINPDGLPSGGGIGINLPVLLFAVALAGADTAALRSGPVAAGVADRTA